MLRAAQHDLPGFEQLPNRFIRDANPGLFGQVIRQPLKRPEGVGQPEAAWASSHHLKQLLDISRCDFGRCSRHRAIFESFDSLAEIPFQPGADGLIIFTHDLGNGWRRQSLFCCQQHDLGAGPQSHISRRSIQLGQCLYCFWCRIGDHDWCSHGSLLLPISVSHFRNCFLIVLSAKTRMILGNGEVRPHPLTPSPCIVHGEGEPRQLTGNHIRVA